VRSRASLVFVAWSLVATFTGLFGAELQCAFACHAASEPAVTATATCHDASGGDGNGVKADQQCRDHDVVAAALEPAAVLRDATPALAAHSIASVEPARRASFAGRAITGLVPRSPRLTSSVLRI
jgi:hypothetical protein